MTMENQNILDDFYSGNTKDVIVDVVDDNGDPFDLTSAEVTYAMFTDKKLVVLQKNSTDGGITISNPATSGRLVIHFTPIDTIDITGSFRHHVNVVDQYGEEHTVLTGKIDIFQAFAQRYRVAHKPAYLEGRAII